MRRGVGLFLVLAGICATLVLGGIAQAGGKECGYRQEAGDCDCLYRHHGRNFKKLAAALGLSAQQKTQIKEIFKKGRAESEPIMTRLISERRALRALIQAEEVDEAAIRAQAGRLAAVEGDMALQRARMAKQIRAILTPEQVAKFKSFQAERDRKFDKFRERMHKRFENITTSK